MSDSPWTIIGSLAGVASVIVGIIGIVYSRIPLAGSDATGGAAGAAAGRSSPGRSSPPTVAFGVTTVVGVFLILTVLLASAFQQPGPGHSSSGDVPTATVALVRSTATSTIAQSPSSQSTSAPATGFQDTLASNANHWVEDAHCFFAGGGLHVKTLNYSGGYECKVPFQNVGNGQISVTVRQTQGDNSMGYGIGFRERDGYHGYTFLISSNGMWALALNTGGLSPAYIVSWTPSNSIRTGPDATNMLGIVSIGADFDLYINGVKVSSQTDYTYASGYTSLEAGSGMEAVFTNLAIAT